MAAREMLEGSAELRARGRENLGRRRLGLPAMTQRLGGHESLELLRCGPEVLVSAAQTPALLG